MSTERFLFMLLHKGFYFSFQQRKLRQQSIFRMFIMILPCSSISFNCIVLGRILPQKISSPFNTLLTLSWKSSAQKLCYVQRQLCWKKKVILNERDPPIPRSIYSCFVIITINTCLLKTIIGNLKTVFLLDQNSWSFHDPLFWESLRALPHTVNGW